MGASKNIQLKGRRTKEKLMKSSFTSILLFTAALIKVLLLYSAPSRFAYNALFLPVFPFLTSNSHITSCNQNVTLCLYLIQIFWNLLTLHCYLRLVLYSTHALDSVAWTVLLVVNLYFCANCLYYVVIFYIHFSFGLILTVPLWRLWAGVHEM